MLEHKKRQVHIACVGKTYITVFNNEVIENLQKALLAEAKKEPTNGAYGLCSNQIQTIYTSFYSNNLEKYDAIHQNYFAYKMMELPSLEEKRVGIMILSKNIEELGVDNIKDFERIFDDDITEWTICDLFATKILSVLIKKSDPFTTEICKWKECDKTWRLRAICIAFVSLAKVQVMTDLCFDICKSVLKSSERFVQLGIGCLLREMSITMSDKLVEFIKENYRYFIREGLRYSIDKLPTKTRKEILSYNTKRRNNKSENDEDDGNDMNENDIREPAQIQPNNQSVMGQSMNYSNFPIQPVYVDMNYYNPNNMMYESIKQDRTQNMYTQSTIPLPSNMQNLK